EGREAVAGTGNDDALSRVDRGVRVAPLAGPCWNARDGRLEQEARSREQLSAAVAHLETIEVALVHIALRLPEAGDANLGAGLRIAVGEQGQHRDGPSPGPRKVEQ